MAYLSQFYGQTLFEKLRLDHGSIDHPEYEDIHFGTFSRTILDPVTTKAILPILAMFADFERETNRRINNDDTFLNTICKIMDDEVYLVVFDDVRKEYARRLLAPRTRTPYIIVNATGKPNAMNYDNIKVTQHAMIHRLNRSSAVNARPFSSTLQTHTRNVRHDRRNFASGIF